MSDFMQLVAHGIRRGQFEVSRRAALHLFALVVGLTLAAALYLMLVSRTAARGRHIQQLQAELFQLQRENEQLEVEIAREGAVPRVWERAIEMGLAPAERVEFLPLADSR